MRPGDRNRFAFPLIFSVALYGVYFVLSSEPRLVPAYLRTIFGPKFQLLHFLAIAPIIILVVRAVDALVFDFLMSKRSGVSAPPLLRDIVSIALYLILFVTALSSVLDYNVRTVLAGGTVLAAVLALALQETLGNLFASIAMHIVSQAAAHVDGVSRDMPCFARVASFGDSAVTYEIKYYMRDYSMRDRIDADIRKALWYAMRRNNIAVPFPIRAYQPYTPPKTEQHHELPRDRMLHRLRQIEILSPLSDEAIESLADAA